MKLIGPMVMEIRADKAAIGALILGDLKASSFRLRGR
jgi:hypothetical protein